MTDEPKDKAQEGTPEKDPRSPARPHEQQPAAAMPAGQAAREPEAETSPGPDQAGGAMAAEDVLALLSAQLEQAEAEKGDLIDRLLRAQAEMDNFRKRTEREREETAKYAITKFARDIVAVADNFERATGAVAPDAAAEHPALAALLDGVRMTEREFLNVLDRHGVKRIAPKGEPFDPHFHQAMMEQHDTAVPAGTVLQVFQSGYLIEDRVLRPAMVVVSKGGPKIPKGARPASEPSETAASADGPGATQAGEPPTTPTRGGAEAEHAAAAAGEGGPDAGAGDTGQSEGSEESGSPAPGAPADRPGGGDGA